jgi:hypothetical protein
MRLLAVPLTAAILLGGCSSAAAPGADDVLDQVDKAKQAGDVADQHNADIEEATSP